MTPKTTARDSDTMTSAALGERLANPSGLILLDVRTPGEFQAGHIGGALNVPVDQLAAHATRIAAADRELVLICQSGARAVTAQGHLVGAGANRTQVLAGGMSAWTADGGDTMTESGQPQWGLERQVRLTAGSIVVAGILGSIVWPKARYLSGGIGAGLIFSAITNTCGMGAMLAKLPYNRGSKSDVDATIARLDR